MSTCNHHRARRARSDRGAVIILVSMLMVALIIIAAIVVDLGASRVARRSAQRAADFAATAGAAALNPDFEGSPVKGCQAAWAYFLRNAPGLDGSSPDPCGVFSAAASCTSSTKETSATKVVGPYNVKITTPVRDNNNLMKGRYDKDVDGERCDRIAVEITRTIDYAFGGIVGRDEGATSVSAVARSTTIDEGGKLYALLVLDPDGCDALSVSGQGTVKVEGNGRRAGEIGVDSSALSCSGSKYGVDVSGTNNASITATDSTDGAKSASISLFALAEGQGNTGAYDRGDVVRGTLSPEPEAARKRITRNPVDWIYNCTRAGRDNVLGTADDCKKYLNRAPKIGPLVTQLGGSGVPSGYSVFPRTGNTSDKCTGSPGDPDPKLPAGNWFVNCPGGFSVKSKFTFQRGNVVFAGSVASQTGGDLRINETGSDDAVVFVREGGIDKDATGSLSIRNTFVYLADGAITLGAGDGSLTWTAPREGDFNDLAMWSESPAMHLLGGQAGLDVEGVFFAPNARPFRFAGQGDQKTEARAQFVTFRLELSGQGELVIRPDPNRAVLVANPAIILIR